MYFNFDDESWQNDGVETPLNPSVADFYRPSAVQGRTTLTCTSLHLTDFAGINAVVPPDDENTGGVSRSTETTTPIIRVLPLVPSPWIVVAVCILIGLDLAFVLLSAFVERRTSESSKNFKRLQRAAARSAIAAKIRMAAEKPGTARLPYRTRIRYALEDNWSLVAILLGESEPGLRRPALLQSVFTQAMLVLCIAVAFSSGNFTWLTVAPAVGFQYIVAHATVVGLLCLPALYFTRLGFALTRRLPWAAYPWRLIRGAIVTAGMLITGRRRTWTKDKKPPRLEGKTVPIPTQAATEARAQADKPKPPPGRAPGVVRERIGVPVIGEDLRVPKPARPPRTPDDATKPSPEVASTTAGDSTVEPPTKPTTSSADQGAPPKRTPSRTRMPVPAAIGSSASPGTAGCGDKGSDSASAASAQMKRERVPPPWELSKRIGTSGTSQAGQVGPGGSDVTGVNGGESPPEKGATPPPPTLPKRAPLGGASGGRPPLGGLAKPSGLGSSASSGPRAPLGGGSGVGRPPGAPPTARPPPSSTTGSVPGCTPPTASGGSTRVPLPAAAQQRLGGAAQGSPAPPPADPPSAPPSPGRPSPPLSPPPLSPPAGGDESTNPADQGELAADLADVPAAGPTPAERYPTAMPPPASSTKRPSTGGGIFSLRKLKDSAGARPASGKYNVEDESTSNVPKVMTRAERMSMVIGWTLQMAIFFTLAGITLGLGIDFDQGTASLCLIAWSIATAETFVLSEPIVIIISATVSHVVAGILKQEISR